MLLPSVLKNYAIKVVWVFLVFLWLKIFFCLFAGEKMSFISSVLGRRKILHIYELSIKFSKINKFLIVSLFFI